MALMIGFIAVPARAQLCPSETVLGPDPGNNCSVTITITDTGASVSSDPSVLPYDTIWEYYSAGDGSPVELVLFSLGDDILVGVVNNSSLPVVYIGLNGGGNPIFAFDGDGIAAILGNPNNSKDTSPGGYGGPNAYFVDINASNTMGVVGFITPIPAHGGTGYFSLQSSVNIPTACSSLISNTPPGSTFPGPTIGPDPQSITASFTPTTNPSTTGISGTGSSLLDAATVCGFNNFDWQQTITHLPMPSPFFAISSPNTPLAVPPLSPFLDPVPGGYIIGGFSTPDNSYPFYYDPTSGELQTEETALTLSFLDRPADACLYPGGTSSRAVEIINKYCKGLTPPTDSSMEFSTRLVGVNANSTATDLGMGFTWTSTWNGTSGGVATTKNDLPPDPGSGTGGVTITSVEDMSDFEGIALTTVNGLPVGGVPPSATQTLGNGNACNGAFTGTFTGNITVSAGQDCTLVNGVISGNVTMRGGSLALYSEHVGGNVQIMGGSGFTIASYTTIGGNLQVQNLPAGTAVNYICNATVNGNLQVQNNEAGVQIGSPSPAFCGGNGVGGNLQANNNEGSVSIFANTARGNLQLDNDGGTTQVFNNAANGNLQCNNNSSITGGGNAAALKQGQCSSF